MKFSADDRTLVFGSDAEVARFREQLCDLLRTALGAAQADSEDVADATARSKEVMKQYNAILKTLNALRRGGHGPSVDG